MKRIPAEQLIEKIRLEFYHSPAITVGQLCSKFGLSQSRISRLLSQISLDLIKTGGGKNTKYFLKRKIADVPDEIVMFEVDQAAKSERIGNLVPVIPRGFLFFPSNDSGAIHYEDLPYFLNDLRPSGFLGRLIPKIHADKLFPDDIRTWSAEQVLRYLVALGSENSGNLVLGDLALSLFYKAQFRPSPPEQSVENYYEDLSEKVLDEGIPGSSAAGEQPKFVCQRTKDSREVLVKFVPRGSAPSDVRRADLLWSEELALKCFYKINPLKKDDSYSWRILSGKQKNFLELTRFDRTKTKSQSLHGRKGLITAQSLNDEFIGDTQLSWSGTAKKLGELKILDRDTISDVIVREHFGKLIGNSDMHLGNLSFYFSVLDFVGKNLTKQNLNLAPIYDMLPMRYMPLSGALFSGFLELQLPAVAEFKEWDLAYKAAVLFWNEVKGHKKISSAFKKIAEGNLKTLKKVYELREMIS